MLCCPYKPKLFENQEFFFRQSPRANSADLIDDNVRSAVCQCETGDPSLAGGSSELRPAGFFRFGLGLAGSIMDIIWNSVRFSKGGKNEKISYFLGSFDRRHLHGDDGLPDSHRPG